MAGRLSGRVHVAHPTAGPRWFGPDDDVPAEYAELITNEKAWAEKPASDSGGDRPAKNDSKAAWVDYAVSQGADRDEAEASTKDDLIAAHGG